VDVYLAGDPGGADLLSVIVVDDETTTSQVACGVTNTVERAVGNGQVEDVP
jgi:hypothetical protein